MMKPLAVTLKIAVNDGFQWKLDKNGYGWCWHDVSPEEEFAGDQLFGAGFEPEEVPFLESNPLDVDVEKSKVYRPLRRFTGLFLRFSETPIDSDAIAKFANLYGPLWTRDADSYLDGELPRWQREILRMRYAVQLWSALKVGSLTEVATLMPRRESLWVTKLCASVLKKEDRRSEIPQQLFSQFQQMLLDLRKLGGEGSEKIVPRAQKILLGLTVARLSRQASVVPVWSIPNPSYRLALSPSSLCGALWLQLASAMQRGADFQECCECRDWFDISVKSARSDKKFCTSTCRMRKLRRERKENPN